MITAAAIAAFALAAIYGFVFCLARIAALSDRKLEEQMRQRRTERRTADAAYGRRIYSRAPSPARWHVPGESETEVADRLVRW